MFDRVLTTPLSPVFEYIFKDKKKEFTATQTIVDFKPRLETDICSMDILNFTIPFVLKFLNVVRCTVSYHLYNLKHVKLETRETSLKVTLVHGCSPRFLNCTNGNKARNASLTAPLLAEAGIRIIEGKGFKQVD